MILAYVLAGCLLYFLLSWQVITEAEGAASSPAWANPMAKALKLVSTTSGAQSTPNLFDNLDCTLATYRLPTSSTMGTGCFTETALGLLESDSGIMIFNGTDEGLPLFTFSPHQVLVPWPQAGALLVLDTVSTGGSYISIYKSPASVLKDQRNAALQLASKQLTTAPELALVDKLGQRLVVNAQSLAFSYSGSWLVAETLNGSFVRINLSTLEIKPFASSFSTSGSPALLKSRLTISSDGRYVAIYNQADGSFKVYDLSNCGAVSVNLQPENCARYDYLPFIKNQIGGLQSIRNVRFVNDGLLSFEAYTTSSITGSIYELAPAETIDSLIDYLGTGDSYTSGEGAFDYLAGTDIPDNMCHLSIRSYPILLTNDLFTSRGGHSVACSGAVIKDVVSDDDTYKGQVKNVLDFKHLKEQNPALLNSVMTNFVPGYVAQQRFIRQYQPAIITVGIGGNDVSFGSLLEQCVGPHISLHHSDNDCFNTYEDRFEVLQLVDRKLKNWASAFKQLKSTAPSANIYAIGYPQIAVDNGNCALNVHLSKSEIEFGSELINYINKTIQEAAGQAGIKYVDISQALIGHRLCETSSYNVAVNGLTAGKDVGIFGIGLLGKESYHPNALGHQLIELEILRKTHNFIGALPSASPVINTSNILNAPKSSRKIVSRQSSNTLAPKVLKKGSTTSVKAVGASNGLKPKTTYTIKLDGSDGKIVGSISSSQVGDIDSTFILPADTVPGSHAIDLVGENQAGETVDVIQPVYVETADNDADGDGVANSTDSCPLSINSGVDLDQDGVDDTCDSVISLPSVANLTPNPPTAGSGSTTSEGTGTLSVRVASSTNTASGAIAVQVTSNLPNSAARTKLTIQGNGKTITNNSKLSIKTQDPAHLPINEIKKSNSNAPKYINPHINWTAWLIAGFLLWLLLMLIGICLENFFIHQAQAV